MAKDCIQSKEASKTGLCILLLSWPEVVSQPEFGRLMSFDKLSRPDKLALQAMHCVPCPDNTVEDHTSCLAHIETGP
jgi:hypothetical protein